MKYIVIIGDGMADYPISELGNITPLQYAKTPNMDLLARGAELGMVKTVPDGFHPGSDVANLSVMGYNPALYYTGRSPFEALSMGIDLAPDDVAFRCNLVTLSPDPVFADKSMVDYSSDEISTAESSVLMKAVAEKFDSDALKFYTGISYRQLAVWHGGPQTVDLTPPHDIHGLTIRDYLPKGDGSEYLARLMEASGQLLADHEVNKARIRRGLKPATHLWFWGQGKKPSLPLFADKYHLKGSVISAVDLTKGLGICAGLRVVSVPGATGNITTDFRGKARAALEELRNGQDFVYIHIEAPDEAGHRGELDTKIRAIEEIDEKVVGEVLRGLEGQGDYKILLMPDHPTPISKRTHTAEEVPYLIYRSYRQFKGAESYSEEMARQSENVFPQGHLLMDHFLKGD
ncbi:MAG: cofactor-independent phosphoglycerate mutase [Bacillota bacterium]